MIEEKWARQFAQEWIAAWNAHDIERILSHYVEDFEMRSPLIVESMGVASGTLQGKAAIRPYWERGLAASPQLCFELLDVMIGANAIAIHYWSVSRGKYVVEVLTFNERREVVSGSAFYGEPAR